MTNNILFIIGITLSCFGWSTSANNLSSVWNIIGVTCCGLGVSSALSAVFVYITNIIQFFERK